MNVLNDKLTDEAHVDTQHYLLYKHTKTNADTIQKALKKVTTSIMYEQISEIMGRDKLTERGYPLRTGNGTNIKSYIECNISNINLQIWPTQKKPSH